MDSGKRGAETLQSNKRGTAESKASDRKGTRHDEIILSSIKVFSRTNYEKATTTLLAKEAGVAEGTLYKYFPSKKELFLECCRHVEGLLLARYREIYRQTAERPLDYLERVAESYIEFMRDNPSMRKFLAFTLNNSFDGDFKRELEGFIMLNVDTSEQMIRKAIENGDLSKDVDARSAAWMFVGGYFTIILMLELGVEEALDPGFLKKTFFAIFD